MSTETAQSVNSDKALVVVPDSAPVALNPQSLDQVIAMSNFLAESQLIPDAYRKSPANVAVAIMFGAEVGLPPMASLRHVVVINGRPTLDAQGIHAVCLGVAGVTAFYRDDGWSVRGEKERWICERNGRKHAGEFTKADAERAGLWGKNTWKGYPADMLENRAIARAGRRGCPDRVGGIHTSEEIINLEEVGPDRFEAPAAPASSNGASETAAQSDAVPEAEPESRDLESEFVELVADLSKPTAIEGVSALRPRVVLLCEFSPDDYGPKAKAEYMAARERVTNG